LNMEHPPSSASPPTAGAGQRTAAELKLTIAELQRQVHEKTKAGETRGLFDLMKRRDEASAALTRARSAKPAEPSIAPIAPKAAEPEPAAEPEAAEPEPAVELEPEVAEATGAASSGGSLAKHLAVQTRLNEWGCDARAVIEVMRGMPAEIEEQTEEYMCAWIMQTITDEDDSKSLLAELSEADSAAPAAAESEGLGSPPTSPVMEPLREPISFAPAAAAKKKKKKKQNKTKKDKVVKRPGSNGDTTDLLVRADEGLCDTPAEYRAQQAVSSSHATHT
jgi:hypothetical protein